MNPPRERICGVEVPFGAGAGETFTEPQERIRPRLVDFTLERLANPGECARILAREEGRDGGDQRITADERCTFRHDATDCNGKLCDVRSSQNKRQKNLPEIR